MTSYRIVIWSQLPGHDPHVDPPHDLLSGAVEWRTTIPGHADWRLVGVEHEFGERPLVEHERIVSTQQEVDRVLQGSMWPAYRVRIERTLL